MLVLGLGMNCLKARHDCGTRYEYLDGAPKFGRLASLAGVVQWQNGSFPSCIRGFDSLRPLQYLADFSSLVLLSVLQILFILRPRRHD